MTQEVNIRVWRAERYGVGKASHGLNPAGLTSMISLGPPLARAMGTQPADMPSTIEIPKCSREAGSASASTSAPVRCH